MSKRGDLEAAFSRKEISRLPGGQHCLNLEDGCVPAEEVIHMNSTRFLHYRH